MSKLHDWFFSMRCKFCYEKLINQKVYVVRGPMNRFGNSEPPLYEAVSCPRCGKQVVLGRHYKRYEASIADSEPMHSIDGGEK